MNRKIIAIILLLLVAGTGYNAYQTHKLAGDVKEVQKGLLLVYIFATQSDETRQSLMEEARQSASAQRNKSRGTTVSGFAQPLSLTQNTGLAK